MSLEYTYMNCIKFCTSSCTCYIGTTRVWFSSWLVCRDLSHCQEIVAEANCRASRIKDFIDPGTGTQIQIRRKNIGIFVLTGSGTVANVTLLQPSATPGSTITFHWRFDILSISATFLPQNAAYSPLPNIFVISLAGPQGQIVGGSVVGPLLAVGMVFVVAATFNNSSYHRLPVQDEQQRTSVSAGGEGQLPVGSSGGGGGGGGTESGHVAGGDSCGMSMYSCHLPPGAGGSDVIWAPTARPPPPPY